MYYTNRVFKNFTFLIIMLLIGTFLGASFIEDLLKETQLCVTGSTVCIAKYMLLFGAGIVVLQLLVTVTIDLTFKKYVNIEINNNFLESINNEEKFGYAKSIGLVIRNKTNKSYTNCTGIIEEMKYMLLVNGKLKENPLTPFTDIPSNKVLIWNSVQKPVCKIDILAKSKENVLLVANSTSNYRFNFTKDKLNSNKSKPVINNFSFCDSSSLPTLLEGLYKLKIRINGKVNDEEFVQYCNVYFFYEKTSLSHTEGFLQQEVDQSLMFLFDDDPTKNEWVKNFFATRMANALVT